MACALVLAACAGLPPAALGAGSVMFSTVPASTGEKPQSKLFHHDGAFWAVIQGPDGVAFYELAGGSWRRGQFAGAVLQASGRADVKWTGTHLFVLVYGSTTRLYKYTYAASARAWVAAAGFPVTMPKPSGAETMVLEQDSSGRLWAAVEGGGNVNVYHSTSADHRSWTSTPIVVRSGVNDDDICSVVAFGGNAIGVFWSDQNRDEFGFRVHRDADPPGTWGAVEAVYPGAGHADDHVNLAADAQGRVYAVTKDAFDKTQVHRRAANGAWSTKVDVLGGLSTRGIVMVADQDRKVYVLYTRWGVAPHRIEYRVADLEALAFGGETHFITSSSDVNNVTGMKQALPPGTLIAVAENGSQALWNGLGSPGSGGTPPGPPQGLVATAQASPAQVSLSWSPPSSGGAAGYHVYRQVDGAAFERLTATPVTATAYTNSNPPQAALCYRITAVGSGGLESVPTNPACVDTRPAPTTLAFEARIASGGDDVEEMSDGRIYGNSGDLEMMNDGSPQRVVGLRFPGVAIPQGAQIVRAWVQFTADESQSTATSLTIRGEAADGAAPFSSASGGLTARLGAATQAAVSWPALASWSAGQAGASQRTPDLAAVVREIVGRPGWRSGNALALLITGSGHRTAVAWETNPAAAALLHVEYESPQSSATTAVASLTPRASWIETAVAPHPLRTTARLRFLLAEPGPLRIDLYDVQGRRVRTVLDHPGLEAGWHEALLDGKDGEGATLPSGIYLYRVTGQAAGSWGRLVVAR